MRFTRYLTNVREEYGEKLFHYDSLTEYIQQKLDEFTRFNLLNEIEMEMLKNEIEIIKRILLLEKYKININK